MIDPANVPPVDDVELLARYVLQRSYVRQNKTIKANAFIPHPYDELSVTRHRDATEDEIWVVGDDVASNQNKTLYGRGDIKALACLQRELEVMARPVVGNPNHADIAAWPGDKAAQKIIALELAAKAAFTAAPPSD
ncbi:MAG: hypothetical protein IID44_06305 [Planctomycetes bacterium]|nr:hypothetical protein [Planctomycetota bacterium]